MIYKWTKKLFSHITDLIIVNALSIHRCGVGTVTHKKFRQHLIRHLFLQAHDQNVTAKWTICGRPSAAAAQISRHEVKHSM
jgi:hypothetical protein